MEDWPVTQLFASPGIAGVAIYALLATLAVAALAASDSELPLFRPFIAAVGGHCISLVVAFLVRRYEERSRAQHEAAVGALEALQQSEMRFRPLAENASDIVFLTSIENGTLLYLNPAVERDMGVSRSEMVGEPHRFLELLHPDDQPSTPRPCAHRANFCSR